MKTKPTKRASVQENQKVRNWRRFLTLPFIAGAFVLVLGGVAVPTVLADRFDEQIRELQSQNGNTRNLVAELEGQAADYRDAMARLQAQIDVLQGQINASRAEQADLQRKIEEGQRELERQRKILGTNIKVMYLEGDISTIEMLASSRNLSEFVDKEEYRTAVQNKIQETLKRITALQNQLKEQKIKVERLLAEQQSQQGQLDGSRAEQRRLLGLNQSQQNEYNQQIKANSAKISELRRQQILENLSRFGGGVQPGIPGGGGYPWGNAYCASTGRVEGACYDYEWHFNNRRYDNWGYVFRNCTSWVAYKLASEGKTGFSNLGNAGSWPSGARNRGIEVTYGSGARVGDAAVSTSGYYGHIAYVEAVLGDGRVVLSDYNRTGDGLYRGPDGGNASVVSQSGLYFIKF